MSSESDIKSYIRAIAGIDDLGVSQLGIVVSINESEMTCEVKPISGDVNYTDVRLIADPDNTATGFYVKPKIGSVVMISPQDEVTYFVSMYSEVEEIWLHGNQYNGLVKVADLVTKLNNLEEKVNEILTAFNTHVHSGGTISGSTGAPVATVPGTLTPTTQSEIENENVKHG